MIGVVEAPAVAARMLSIFPCKERRESIGGMAGVAGHIAVTAEQR